MPKTMDLLLGRGPEVAELRDLVATEGPHLISVSGPRGRGKTALLHAAFQDLPVVHFQASNLPEGALVRDLEALALVLFGEVPTPRRPGVLPLPSGEGGWLSLLIGIVDRIEADGRRLIVIFDGMDPLLSTARGLPAHLAEMFESALSRGLPLSLVLTARSRGVLESLSGPDGPMPPPDLEVSLGSLPFRVAGWGHGAVDAEDAFHRWALLGDHPAHLPRTRRRRSLEGAVLSRVLRPSGDLFESPLRRLEGTFQRPARYAAILRALSSGPLDWSGILERAPGIETGGQLAPYLRRLEEEGLVVVELPLDADPESRSRRYGLANPFLSFWFGSVLPHRSLLLAHGAEQVWKERIRPSLSGHMQVWLEEAARRWLLEHAEEQLGAPARQTGALWAGDADFPVAGRLTNGQVCYGLVEWGDVGGLAADMTHRMKEVRYGLGREARSPLFFLAGGVDEELRRLVAREPLARIIGFEQLMGTARIVPGT